MEERDTSGGGESKLTSIKVRVDTGKINQNNIEQHVKFSDNHNPNPGNGRPQDFVSTVKKGGKVSWEGIAENNTGDSVEIVEIIPKESEGKGKVLERVENDNGRRGVKIGHIRNQAFKGDEPYSVKFRINDDPAREFLVDPKLRMI